MGPLSRRLSILIYHRVLAEPDPIFPDAVSAERFDRQLQVLARWFRVLPLTEAVRRLRDGTLPPRSACITFDDGYADNACIALPLLQARGLAATFFIATGFLNGGRMWNDTVIEAVRRAPAGTVDGSIVGLGRLRSGTLMERRSAIAAVIDALKYRPMEERQQLVADFARRCGAALPADLMMTDAQVRQLHRAGMTIGGHTVNHPILARLDPERARDEIEGGKRDLEGIIAEPVELFAYPNGKPGQDYSAEHVAIVRQAGFRAAVSTAWGVAEASRDPYQLPRFTPWDRGTGRFALRLLHNTFRTQAPAV